ncbi:type III secretion system chaperone [Vibrio sp. AND4]|uniref:type III secretion system chaperone n=1 Tax=Vibrio sp. AND4 TaxID=314289 RepID=UPI00015F313F|nr:type III secretion system chaperone [Vibrio sp. AND4]EDP60386.1 hypothetical protein AND4_05699 [Vibrio sp. AND4]
MTKTTFNELLSNVAQCLGLDSLKMDDSGICELLINEESLIILRKNEANNSLLLLSQVTATAGAEDKNIASKIFFEHSSDALLGNGPELAWHDDIGLIAYKSLCLSSADAQKVCEQIGLIIEWISMLSDTDIKQTQASSDNSQRWV